MLRRLFVGLLLSLSVSLPCWAGASRTFITGNSDRLVIADVTGVTDFAATDNFTIAFWVNLNANTTSNDAVVEKWAGSNGYPYVFRANPDGGGQYISFARYDGTNNPSKLIGTLDFTTWHFVMGVRQDSDDTMYLYFDCGTALTVSDSTSSTTTNASSLYVGSRGGSSEFADMDFAYLQIFNRALAAAECNQIRYKPGSIAGGLVGYWPVAGSNSPELDLSGNGNTATVTGPDESSDGPQVFLMSPMARLIEWLKRLLDPVVWADDIVFCNPTAIVLGQVSSYAKSDDPVKSGALTNPNSLIWSLPPSPVRPWDGVAPAGLSTYWKCVDTDADAVPDAVVEMTQAEKDVVDAPALVEAARQQAFTDEVVANDLCTAELSEIVTRINTFRDATNTEIAAASTVIQIKSVMTNLNNTYAAAFRKVARCTRARAR